LAAREPAAKPRQEVQRVVYRDAQGRRRGHHRTDFDLHAEYPHGAEDDDRRKHVGDHRDQPRPQAAQQDHHGHCNEDERDGEAAEQIVEQLLLRPLHDGNAAGVDHLLDRRQGIARLDAPADFLLQLFVQAGSQSSTRFDVSSNALCAPNAENTASTASDAKIVQQYLA